MHGDIKPDNILCDASGRFFFCDVEVAKRLYGTFDGAIVGRTIGTLPYMAIEMLHAIFDGKTSGE